MSDFLFDRGGDDDPRPAPTQTGERVREPRRDRRRREREDRKPRRLGRWLGLLGLLVVLGLLGLGLGAAWVQRRIDPPGDPGERLSVSVPRGATTTDVAELLADQGVVADAQVFRYYLRYKDGGPFQAGEYELRENSSMGDVLDALDKGPRLEYVDLTVPEGRWASDVAALVGEVRDLSPEAFSMYLNSGQVRSQFQPPDVASLEGLLFPDTYRLDEGEDELAILQRMVATLDATAVELGYADAPTRVGRTPYETLVIASLIEAEARVDGDRARISRVIHNRLEQDISLGIDATVYYALQRRGGGLTESDLAIDSPYNTRDPNRLGLPPTPIGLPGRAAMEAALNPEPGPWLYYVLADASGAHAFSATYEEFQRDVAAAQDAGLIP